jgi:hypothetical protein
MLFGKNVKWQQAKVKRQDLGSRIWGLVGDDYFRTIQGLRAVHKNNEVLNP